MQNKLVSAFSEYRLLHKQSSRQLPHNKLLYPPALRYLPLWMLGEFSGALQCPKVHSQSVLLRLQFVSMPQDGMPHVVSFALRLAQTA